MIEDELRARILADPGLVLDDRGLMRALMTASDSAIGKNIVDLRGMALERLESRYDRLEETHRAVIAAAYENLAGTNQIHRAVLRLLDPSDFQGFIKALDTDVAEILRIDTVRLVLESPRRSAPPDLGSVRDVLLVAEPGYVESYMSSSRGPSRRHVLLRQAIPDADAVHGSLAPEIRSEAMMRLDLGEGRLPGMLVMGSEDPHMFRAGQGTDLLAFFSGVFERQMRRFLS